MFMNALSTSIAEMATIEQEPLLQSTELNFCHPFRPVRMAIWIDAGNKIHISGQRNDEDEIAH